MQERSGLPGLLCYSGQAADNPFGALIGQSFTGPVFARIWDIAEVVALFAGGGCGL